MNSSTTMNYDFNDDVDDPNNAKTICFQLHSCPFRLLLVIVCWVDLGPVPHPLLISFFFFFLLRVKASVAIFF